MKRDNKTRYALLGILSQSEGSGYDIKKFIEGSIGYFWAESYGQIYPNLKSLEKEGLISSRPVGQKKGTEKQVYSITRAGRQKLSEWLSKPVEIMGMRNELLLKIFFGSEMNRQDMISLLKNRRLQLEKTLDEYRSIAKTIHKDVCDSPNRPYWQMTLEYGLRSAEAEIEWIKSVKKTIKKM